MDERARNTPTPEATLSMYPDGRCPVETGIELVGGKWKLLIIRALASDGASRFNHLSRVIGGISHKVLTQNLRDLEADGLLQRVEDEGHVLYDVTPIGAELTPILHTLGEWRRRYDAGAGAS